MHASSDPASGAVPSATVLVLRDGDDGVEVLLLRRNPALRAMGGAWVFPGGKIDVEDAGRSTEDQARSAAVRELAEETGLRIERSALEDFSHWLTPLGVKHRFATWFYVCHCAELHSVEVDGSEIIDHQWMRPSAAIAMQNSGAMVIAPPTLVSLADLLPCESAAAVMTMSAGRQPPYFFPRIIPAEDATYFLYPGDSGYESSDPHRRDVLHRSENRKGALVYLRNFDWPARGQ